MLNLNLDESVFDDDGIGFDADAVGQSFSGAYVEAPAVQAAFDHVATETTIGQRRSLVRAEIFDGVKFAVDVVKGQFRSVQQFDGRAASHRHVLRATNRDKLALALRLSEISKLFTKLLHHTHRSKEICAPATHASSKAQMRSLERRALVVPDSPDALASVDKKGEK